LGRLKGDDSVYDSATLSRDPKPGIHYRTLF
jgi:hypothetical protein